MIEPSLASQSDRIKSTASRFHLMIAIRLTFRVDGVPSWMVFTSIEPFRSPPCPDHSSHPERSQVVYINYYPIIKSLFVDNESNDAPLSPLRPLFLGESRAFRRERIERKVSL
jgi:hypothetical protein